MDNPLDLTNLIDIHAHLGSSVSPHILWEIANEQGINVGEKDYWKFIDSVVMTQNSSYDEYINYFHLTEKIQSSTDAIERATHSVISGGYRRSDIHTIEIRFNPMNRNRNGERDLDKIILSALYGMKKACLEYPVKAGIIIMLDRRFTYEQNEKIVDKAIKFKNDGVVGIDIGGPITTGFMIENIAPLFKKARDAGLKLTVHTGEATPASEVQRVIEVISPDRIGHGIRSIDDPNVLQMLSEKQIVLEVCPTSNIRTQVVKKWEDFKNIFQTFEKYNVRYTINTDGCELVQTTIKKEFETLFNKKILTKSQIYKAIQTAKESTFI